MHVNPGKLIKIKRKPTFQSKTPPFRDAMFFEVDNTTTTTTVATTVTTSTTVTTTTKKKSFISRQFFIHQPSPIPIPSSSSSSSSSFSLRKRRPLLRKHSNSSSSSSASSTSANNSSRCTGRFAELAGGTTAECAAICCCCPCGLVNLLYLTIYKVPAGLCRRAWRRKKRKQLIKKGLLPPKAKRCRCGCDETEIQIHPAAGILESAAAGGLVDIKFDEDESEEDEGEELEEDDDDDAMVKLEKEMWETFYSTGFWRSPSQREKSTVVIKDLSSSNSVAKVKSI